MLREREAEKVDSVGSDASSEVDPNKAALVSKVVTGILDVHVCNVCTAGEGDLH